MIDGYVFGTISINGDTFNNDVEARWSGDVLKWKRKDSHSISLSDLEPALGQSPEVIYLGTGYDGTVRINEGMAEELKKKNIELIANKTNLITQEFNVAVYSKKKAIGLFCLN
ncbi:MAG: MTH938/NDUFAF3 family protein [Candidatus Falkowbacteria bacterium]